MGAEKNDERKGVDERIKEGFQGKVTETQSLGSWVGKADRVKQAEQMVSAKA